MKLVKLAAYAVAGMLLVGCAQQPPVLPEVQELQRKSLTAKHWRSLADRVVSNLVCDPDKSDKPVKDAFRSTRALYIASPAPDMPFSDTFKMYLRKSLLDRGIRVSKNPINADILSFRVQRFLYDQRSGLRHPFDKATFWTTLGALGVVAAENYWTTNEGIAALLVAGPVLDFLAGMANVTNAEVVITAFIETEQTIPFIYAEEFYVEPQEILPNGVYWTDFPVVPMGELGQMLARYPQGRTIRVVSK
jgi:hypothetical protein